MVNENNICSNFEEFIPQKIMEREQSENDENNQNKLNLHNTVEDPKQQLCDKDISTDVIKPLDSDNVDVNNEASNNVLNITEGKENGLTIVGKSFEQSENLNRRTLSNECFNKKNDEDSCFKSRNNHVMNDEEISDCKEQSESVFQKKSIGSLDEEYESDRFGCNNRNRKTKISAILNSDSDSEQETSKPDSSPKPNENIDNHINSDGDDDGLRQVPNKKLKRIAVIDSDSEDEAPETLRGMEAEPQDLLQIKEPSAEIFVIGNNGELIKENETHAKTQKNIWSNLCDPESSEEESNKSCNENGDEDERISDSELNNLQTNNVMDKKSKNRTKKKVDVNKNKEEKMTAKKALEDRKKILAESQRRVRDSQISLPYHKPKHRTLKEFLQNRPKLAMSLNTTQVKSPVAAIKMSTEQLKIISNQLKHREKEVEEFYKSDSEPENEENEEEREGELNEQQEVACSSEENNVSSAMSGELKNIQNQSEAMEIETTSIKSTDAVIESLPDENIVSNSDNYTNKQENCENSDKNDDSVVHRNDVLNEISEDMEIDSSEHTLLIHSEKNQTYEKLELQEEKTFDSTKMPVSEAEDDGRNQSCLKANEPNPVSPEKGNKLTIISNIILQPSSNQNDENLYTLDAELSELASEAKENNQRHSDNYEFNLDDIEEESQYISNDNDAGLKKDKRKSEMVEKLAHIKPRLSGAPNLLIDLENDEVIPDEVSRLRERFIQHNSKIGKHAHKQEISIVSVTDGEIHKETLALNIDEDDEENLAPIEKPGVRLKKLREELQLQMAQKRSELWKDKMNNVAKNENDDEGEKSDCGMDDILDIEDEEDLTESEDEDLEENDCDMSEKVKKKSAFVDEEADESDIEDNEEEVNEKDMEEDEVDEDGIEEQTEHEADVEDTEEQIEDETPKKKVLKRIVKPFDNEESDDEEDYSVTRKNNLFDLLGNKLENYVKSDDQILSSCDQPANYKIRGPLATPTNSGAEFLTPVTYMTGLKNLNTSALKFAGVADTSPVTSTLGDSMQIADESDLDSVDTKKALAPNYSESDILGTQDVLAICSGEFPNSLNTVSSPEISTQQLREIFTKSDSNVQTSGSDFNTQDLADICSGKFIGTPLDAKQREMETLLDENDEHMISQLIDEEELERFKQKFVSPITNDTQRTIAPAEIEEVHGTGGVIDSEDEDEGLKLKKKKRKRLAFSDDESEDEVEEEEEEIVDLHDKEDTPSNVEYDSEENEIDSEEEMLRKEERRGEILKATEFFEKEAELSESEWGSEDEDEKNLDDMEFEKGDEEKFDDDELRTDIERIQMRQMLDEDNREVKLLQELLLEDGELHGSGRQRQFRWKNIGDGNNENGETKMDDDDNYLDDDDETEEQWRKSRHQRELFLMKKQTQLEEDSLVTESQKLSFSYKPMNRISQTSKVSQTISVTSTNSPEVKQPFKLLNKRGSFLSRGEKILQKFAEATKVSLTTKTTNRIVFQAVEEVNIKKRKSLPQSSTNSDTPIALKKLKLAGSSPAVKKERLKIGKSLFSDIVID